MTAFALDVATLRSALDLLGGEPKAEGGIADLDIAALGTLVEAICFADEVLVPDLGHRLGSQLAGEGGDAIRHVSLTYRQRDTLTNDALDWVHRHCDLDILIELLGARASRGRGRWGSDDFLVLQAVGVEGKYESAVVQAIRSEELNMDPALLNRTGNRKARPGPQKYEDWERAETKTAPRLVQILEERIQVTLKGESYASFWLVQPEFRPFVANLAWALLRSRSYLLWAHENGVPYMPHPLRARMTGYAAAADDTPREFIHHSEREALVHKYLGCVESIHEEGLEAFAEVAGTGLVRFPFPTILPYVVERAGSKERVLEAAYEVRDSRGARSLRRRISRFEEKLAAGDLHAAVRLRNELDRLSQKLRQDLGLVHRPSIATTLSVGLPGVSAQFPGPRGPAAVAAQVEGVVDRVHRPWLVFLRDVFDAIASASSLGRLYDVLYPQERGP